MTPADIVVMSLQGVDQAVFNRNLQNVDLVLNAGGAYGPNPDDHAPAGHQGTVVVFPFEGYALDPVKCVELNTTLMFFRDWIHASADPYLVKDPQWKTYCAEHKKIVADVAANLPTCEKGFKEVFGEEEGAALWKDFQAAYARATNGRTFQETQYFTPLWKKEGYSRSRSARGKIVLSTRRTRRPASRASSTNTAAPASSHRSSPGRLSCGIR